MVLASLICCRTTTSESLHTSCILLCLLSFAGYNDLTGVPIELGNLNLDIVNLNGNQITGSLDSVFCSNPNVFDVLSADCLGDNPKVSCSCCTECCDSEGLGCTEISNPNAIPPDVESARLTKLREILEPVSGQEILDDTSSDQYKAIIWMAGSDPLQDLDSTLPELVIQRYVMVLLYFATNGGSWKNNNGWLSETSVCSWDGIKCSDSELINTIDLSDNNLGGRLVGEIGALGDHLSFLLLHTNELLGEALPSEIGLLKGLQRLVLHDTALSGFLPTEIGGLTTLVELDISHCELSGPIPSEIGLLQEAEYIKLGYNQLDGNIPSEIGMASILLILELNDNLISGTIPTEISQLLPAIVDIRRNNLSGGIPSEIGRMTILEELYISKFVVSILIPSLLVIILYQGPFLTVER